MYCTKCGSKINADSKFCQSCGAAVEANQRQPSYQSQPQRPYPNQPIYRGQPQQGGKHRELKMVYPDQCKMSPVESAALSVLIVGFGQMVNGQLPKGALLLIIAIAVSMMIGYIAAPIFWIISGFDAYRCASKLRSGMAIGWFSFF